MTDITNRVVKICRRITEIEHALACNDQSEKKIIEFGYELEQLNEELITLRPAIVKDKPFSAFVVLCVK